MQAGEHSTCAKEALKVMSDSSTVIVSVKMRPLKKQTQISVANNPVE